MPEWVTLVEISQFLKNEYGIEITDRSLGRYRDEFQEYFSGWIQGRGRQRKYNQKAITVFKTIVEGKQTGNDRQDIESQLRQDFGLPIDTKNDRQTTERQEEDKKALSIAISDNTREFILSIPKVIENQQKIIEQQAELIKKMEERLTVLEEREHDTWWRRWFKREK